MMGALTSAIRAEAVRTKGSAAAALPWVGIILAGISTAGILITPENQERAALLWQTLYVTGMAAPLMTLLAGLTTVRETTARDGGTLWRATSPRTIIVARFIVLAGLSALFHALAFWLVIPLSVAVGAPTDIPRLLWAGLACWVATLGLLALAFVLTERSGTIPVFLAALVWQVIGALAAETTAWFAIPPTWAVRSMLPVLGAHQNAEPLAAGDPLATESPILALTLSVLLTALVLVLRVLLPGTLRMERGTNNRPVGRRSTRESAVGAIRAVMRSRAVMPLCAPRSCSPSPPPRSTRTRTCSGCTPTRCCPSGPVSSLSSPGRLSFRDGGWSSSARPRSPPLCKPGCCSGSASCPWR